MPSIETSSTLVEEILTLEFVPELVSQSFFIQGFWGSYYGRLQLPICSSSLQHNIPCSFCIVLILWNLFLSNAFFFFLVRSSQKRDFMRLLLFCSNTMFFRLLHIFRYKQFVNYVFFVHLLFQKVLLFT